MEPNHFLYGFIGFGHMGSIIFEGITKAHLVSNSRLFFTRKDPKKKIETEMKYGITAMTLPTLVEKCDVIFFCIPPQKINEIFSSIPQKVDLSKKLLLSILAGTKISAYEKALGEKIQVARIMPNAPSSIGEGMNIVSWGKNIQDDYAHLTRMIFSCMGQIEELPESFMNAVTGICGSGPGFVYKLLQAFVQVGVEQGLSKEVAMKLASQTFIGASKMIFQGMKPQDLIDDISLPGGTTVAGFQVFDDLKIKEQMQKVLLRSIERAQELQ